MKPTRPKCMTMKTSLKDWRTVYRNLKVVTPEMNEDERIQFARSLAATPDERWEMNVNCIKLLGLSGPIRSRRSLERRKTKLGQLQKPSLWRLQVSTEELVRGRIMGTNCTVVAPCKS